MAKASKKPGGQKPKPAKKPETSARSRSSSRQRRRGQKQTVIYRYPSESTSNLLRRDRCSARGQIARNHRRLA